jgi:hypothetical protein
MSNRIKVKPFNPDAVMYDPTTGRRLPPEGMWVAPHQFWDRRRIHREVEFIDEPDPDAEAASSSERSSERSTPTGREPLTPITTR